MKTRLAPLGAMALIFIGAGVLTQGCSPSLGPNEISCPPYEDFAPVSTLLEQRCGTLDCHGMAVRPLRIYGAYGLRLPPEEVDPNADEYYSGNLAFPTTEDERFENYQSVCGLEPEKMAYVQAGEPADTLTIVRKPRLTEKHKGGRIWDEGKAEDSCLLEWIGGEYPVGEMNPAKCEDALAR